MPNSIFFGQLREHISCKQISNQSWENEFGTHFTQLGTSVGDLKMYSWVTLVMAHKWLSIMKVINISCYRTWNKLFPAMQLFIARSSWKCERRYYSKTKRRWPVFRKHWIHSALTRSLLQFKVQLHRGREENEKAWVGWRRRGKNLKVRTLSPMHISHCNVKYGYR